jgi:hypothetical protein
LDIAIFETQYQCHCLLILAVQTDILRMRFQPPPPEKLHVLPEHILLQSGHAGAAFTSFRRIRGIAHEKSEWTS